MILEHNIRCYLCISFITLLFHVNFVVVCDKSSKNLLQRFLFIYFASF